jgi:glycosyltransferase involved in cell wall biosynthesis
LPTSVIEAASYGKPCIVTDATNIGDLITAYQAGESIDNQDSEELGAAMTRLAALREVDTDFSTCCQNAIRMVTENFNWERVIQEFNAKLYQR